MNVLSWAILVAAIAIFFTLFLVFKKQIEKETERKFLKISQDALNNNTDQFLKLAKQNFEFEQLRAKAELEMKKQAVENSVNDLKEELEKYRSLIREFEQDRNKKYGSLENELKNTSSETRKLQETTTRLTNILGNVKLRGQWGERMAEDIIKSCGFIEGVNFRKQTKLDSATTKPDYTFLLPDKHTINMDVKFPLDNYLNMVNAEEAAQKDNYKKEFLKNVSMRIKEIQNRSYINPDDKTLDFVLLFIPNEQVYGFIQESMPGLIDESLQQKVVLCSPFTLYAMLSVIRQAFENFHYEKATKEIVKMINLFLSTYDVFKNRFEDIGKSIEKLQDQYNDVTQKSFKNLDTKIKRIISYKGGHAEPLGQAENDNPEIIDLTPQISDENKED